MFTANLRLRFFVVPPRKIHFRGYSRTTNENFRSKFAREPTYFQEFLDPTKKGKRNLHNFHTGPSPTAVLGAHCSFNTFCIRDSRTGNYSNSQNSVSQRITASYIDFQFSTISSGEICHANKHFNGQLALLGSLLSRTEQRGNSKCIFLRIVFCSERSISTYPAHRSIESWHCTSLDAQGCYVDADTLFSYSADYQGEAEEDD